jgi:hypothetical protein
MKFKKIIKLCSIILKKLDKKKKNKEKFSSLLILDKLEKEKKEKLKN